VAIALWPSLLLGLAAWGIAAWRVIVLSLHAAVDAPQLVAALERRLGRGDRAGALALCCALPRCWAAELGVSVLRDVSAAAELSGLLEELRSTYRLRAELGIGALTALSRMAFPLALGGAIVALSSALTGTSAVTQVERALGSALQCMTVGVLTSVFCRLSAELLRKQATRRLHEVAAVARALTQAVEQLQR
jgi:hypothetical protein